MRQLLTSKVLYAFASIFFVVVGTALAIQYAKGNLRFTKQGLVQGTGLLSANSFPTGAEVIIDGKLATATDDTLYLDPGRYEVELVKDGYVPWKKTLTIEKELVTQTNARLFPSVASFTPLTFTGVKNISPSPDGQRIVYFANSATSDRKNGLYVLDLTTNALTIQKGPRQITTDSADFDLEHADIIWSPDSSEIIVSTPNKEVLLTLDKLNEIALLPDVSFRKQQILSEWEEEMFVRERQFLTQFPTEIIAIATASAKDVYISPDKKRLLYTATAYVTIPDTIVPPLPATNQQPEERSLTPGTVYVYDREEDKNFKISTVATQSSFPDKKLLVESIGLDPTSLRTASAGAFTTLQASTSAQTAQNFITYHSPLYANTYQWFPDSKHLLYTSEGTIKTMEYDATNETVLYSGPFGADFLYPWPDGNRLLIVASFSPDVPDNLYAIELK